MLKEQIFADGVGSITVIGGAVRLDLFSFSSTEKNTTGQPKAVPHCQLVITIPGFLNSAAKIQEAVEAIGKIGTAAAVPKNRHEAENSVTGSVESSSPTTSAKKDSKRPFP
jgi:hypothetical protein